MKAKRHTSSFGFSNRTVTGAGKTCAKKYLESGNKLHHFRETIEFLFMPKITIKLDT